MLFLDSKTCTDVAYGISILYLRSNLNLSLDCSNLLQKVDLFRHVYYRTNISIVRKVLNFFGEKKLASELGVKVELASHPNFAQATNGAW